MKAGLRWILFVVVTLACVAIGYGAYTLAGISWDAVVSYESLHAAVALPPAAPAPAQVPRTVLVIVDGLRLDASRQMGTLSALREYGADMELEAPQPTLSYPNWTTLLAGASPEISGVVTNWHEGPAPVETLFDTARSAGVKTVFVGPEDFQPLYGVKEKTSASFMLKWDESYLSGTYVDRALQLAETQQPRLLVLHLPDVDEAGHAFGGASDEYAKTVAKVDGDLGRLVQGLQDGETVFVVVSDHGHIDTGGHGGWEDEAKIVPAVFAGPGIIISSGTGLSEDVAPTVAILAGAAVPRHAIGEPIASVVRADEPTATANASAAFQAFEGAYVRTVTEPLGQNADAAMASVGVDTTDHGSAMEAADLARLSFDRDERLQTSLLAAIGCLAVLALIGIASWRALVAALAGTATYYLVYNGLFFVVHRYAWSLSAFNSEDKIEAWMNGRLIEAALSMLAAAAVAAVVYPYLRSLPRMPRGSYLPGWLTLGPATALATLATLGVQVAWFVWAWGIDPVWGLPDLKWGFKYDLDLIQATAVGFVAVLTPLVTYLVGRYHPRVRITTAEE